MVVYEPFEPWILEDWTTLSAWGSVVACLHTRGVAVWFGLVWC